MTEARVGRLLAASLHQAIAEVMPLRLEFYEDWLGSDGVRGRNIGMAPMIAVLGFLRTEDAYDRVMSRAGRLAAEWTISSMSSFQRRAIALLPRSLRARVAMRIAAGIVSHVCSATRVATRVGRDAARLDVRESLFCSVREPQSLPLCVFYGSVAVTALESVGIPGRAHVERCRAVGAAGCLIAIDLTLIDVVTDKAMAA
jgi:hypothetical protein